MRKGPILYRIGAKIKFRGKIIEITENNQKQYKLPLSIYYEDLESQNERIFQFLNFSNADLTELNLSNKLFQDCIFAETDFSHSRILDCVFYRMRGELAIFDYAQIYHSDFHEAYLLKSSFYKPYLYNINFEKANLIEANFVFDENMGFSTKQPILISHLGLNTYKLNFNETKLYLSTFISHGSSEVLENDYNYDHDDDFNNKQYNKINVPNFSILSADNIDQVEKYPNISSDLNRLPKENFIINNFSKLNYQISKSPKKVHFADDEGNKGNEQCNIKDVKDLNISNNMPPKVIRLNFDVKTSGLQAIFEKKLYIGPDDKEIKTNNNKWTPIFASSKNNEDSESNIRMYRS